ncbi:MAG: CoA transferase, partial [Alphaproteobacteria bacterium]
LSVMDDKAWVKLCSAIERADLITDPRFAEISVRFENDALAKEIVGATLEMQPFDYWTARLAKAGVLHERVNDYLEFLAHPHTVASNAVQWTDHPEIGRIPVPNIPGVEPAPDGDPRAQAPRLGEHTNDILAGLGFEAADIEALRRAGAVTGK